MPTFDEWFRTKYGSTFEEMHMQGGMLISDSMRALTRYLREYTTEMARAA